ncbi:MAG: glycosyltransferase, partial [Ornithinimicrobium sp.]
LDVLSDLLKHDRSWRLLLVGRQFAPFPSATGLNYQREFARRLEEDGLHEHVEIRGFTTRLEELYEGVGFVLSCSRREGYGVAFAEGVASGAVPILRDWPIFASLDAAARTFSPEWVVQTPAEAAARIRGASTPKTWRAATDAAQAQIVDMASADDTLRRLRSVINVQGSHRDSLDS